MMTIGCFLADNGMDSANLVTISTDLSCGPPPCINDNSLKIYENTEVGDEAVYTCLMGRRFRNGHIQKTSKCVKKLTEDGRVVAEWEPVKGQCLREYTHIENSSARFGWKFNF